MYNEPNDGIVAGVNDVCIDECVRLEMIKHGCRPDCREDPYESARLECVYQILADDLEYFKGLPNTIETRYALRAKVAQVVARMMQIM